MCIQRNGILSKTLKFFLIVMLILTFLMTFTGCGKVIAYFVKGMPSGQDWQYDKLPNNYKITHININQICLSPSINTVLDDFYIMEFCNNDRYIGLKGIMAPQGNKDSKPVSELDKSNPLYYLVDTEKKEIFGSFTPDEYTEKLASLEIDDMCDWIKTVPMPKGAYL